MKSLLLLLCLAPVYLFAQIKLETKSFLDGKIELSVPADFKPISDEMMKFKYANQAQKPQLILTDEDAEVNLIINLSPQHLTSGQVGQFKDYQMNSLKSKRPDAKWLKDGVRPINGKQVGYLQFMVDAKDQKVFNYYFFTDLDGQVLFCSFNCIEKLLPKWKDTVETIVSSLKVRPPAVREVSKE